MDIVNVKIFWRGHEFYPACYLTSPDAAFMLWFALKDHEKVEKIKVQTLNGEELDMKKGLAEMYSNLGLSFKL